MNPVLRKILRPPYRAFRSVLAAVQGWFWRTFRNDYSQHGETVAIRRLLAGTRPGFFVEIGANDGLTISSTHGLMRDGWGGLCVEAAEKTYRRLVGNVTPFPGVKPLHCACAPTAGEVVLYHGKNDPEGFLATISTEDSAWFRENRDASCERVAGKPLTAILDENGAPAAPDLLLVDAEGMDLEVLRSLDFARYRPRLIVSEEYEPKSAEKRLFLEGLGYCLVERRGSNTFWM